MAKKRMFDRAIIDTDKFMDLPISGKAIYFLLGMEADDEGFVSYKKVIRIHGGNEDDIKVLVAKGFLIMFKSGVVVITDWNKNNWLDSRRISTTEYTKERGLLTLNDKKEYVLSSGLASAKREESSIEEYRIEEKSIDSDVPSQDIISIIDSFKEVNPSYNKWYKNKTQREAITRLIKTHSFEQVLKVITLLPKTNGMSYMPTITTPLQLEDKWSQLEIAFLRKKNEIQSKKSNVI